MWRGGFVRRWGRAGRGAAARDVKPWGGGTGVRCETRAGATSKTDAYPAWATTEVEDVAEPRVIAIIIHDVSTVSGASGGASGRRISTTCQ